LIVNPKINYAAKGPAIVQISKSLVGLKQDAEQISKARDELRREFENYVASVVNETVGDKLRELALESTKLNHICQSCKNVREQFKKYGLQLNYGNLLKPVDEKIFYYSKLDVTKFDNNLTEYSKTNQKLLVQSYRNVKHIKTEYE
jgi:hypothetical protein